MIRAKGLFCKVDRGQGGEGKQRVAAIGWFENLTGLASDAPQEVRVGARIDDADLVLPPWACG